MVKACVVFVVGHRRWGKSTTLSALADGMRRYISLEGVEFFIRRMSNDDKPREFYMKMRKFRPVNTPCLIVAFCPTMKEEPNARRCLERLRRKRYCLFFWVLRRQQMPGTKGVVKTEEIESLAKYGKFEVFEGRFPQGRRAEALRRFIRDTVLAERKG